MLTHLTKRRTTVHEVLSTIDSPLVCNVHLFLHIQSSTYSVQAEAKCTEIREQGLISCLLQFGTTPSEKGVSHDTQIA